MAKVWYFAYGSNMDPARMEERVGGWHLRIPGRLFGFRLAFNKRAYGQDGVGFANIVPDAGGVVEGVLYLLNAAALEVLDRYEGYPEHYTREEREITSDEGAVRAWVYIATPAWTQEGLRPPAWYLAHLLEGARGMVGDAWLRMLERVPTLDGGNS